MPLNNENNQIKKKVGGARPGAGRKPRPNKQMRIPLPLVPKIETIIKQWREETYGKS